MEVAINTCMILGKIIYLFVAILFDFSFMFVLQPFFKICKYFIRYDLDDTLFKNKGDYKKALLLVHGSGVTELNFLSARNIINKLMKKTNKYYKVYACNLNEYCANKNEIIEDYCKKLYDKIQKIKDDNVEEITLIGHSMGGLVSAYCAENYDIPVKTIITIGTPWQGSPILKPLIDILWYKGKRYRQMLPGSKWLDTLHEQIKKSKITYYAYGSNLDYVVPYKYSIMDSDIYKNFTNKHISYHGHVMLILSGKTWREIFDVLSYSD
jgi:triacylglycerol esterase/lipase EstA (alpha/beta hydrolase family)